MIQYSHWDEFFPPKANCYLLIPGKSGQNQHFGKKLSQRLLIHKTLMKQYLDLVQHILDHGEKKQDRTGTGTISVFGYQCKYDLRQGFPLLTTKKVLFDALVYELLWFLRGSTNINDDLKAAYAYLERVGPS